MSNLFDLINATARGGSVLIDASLLRVLFCIAACTMVLTFSCFVLLVFYFTRHSKSLQRSEPVCEDSSEQKKADQSVYALQSHLAEMTRRTNDRNNYINSIFSSIEDGIVVLDELGKVILFNPKAAELLGLGSEIFFEGRFSEYLEKEPLASIMKLCASQGATHNSELCRLPASEGRTFEVRITSVIDKYQENKNFGSLAVVKDITEWLRLENIKKDFVAAVSHEFRTPLTLISGFLEMLKTQKSIKIENRTRALEIMDIETERLKRLVEELLTISEIGSALPHGTNEPFDLATAIQDSVEAIKPLAEKKELSLKYELDLGGARMQGNENWLFLAVKNLLENGVKYTSFGGSVSLSAFRSKDSIVVEVTDTGIGIALEEQEKIFERFYRVEKARGSGSGGSGLGLALVKDVASIFGGNISVHSSLGQGSVFTLSLPRKNWSKLNDN